MAGPETDRRDASASEDPLFSRPPELLFDEETNSEPGMSNGATTGRSELGSSDFDLTARDDVLIPGGGIFSDAPPKRTLLGNDHLGPSWTTGATSEPTATNDDPDCFSYEADTSTQTAPPPITVGDASSPPPSWDKDDDDEPRDGGSPEDFAKSRRFDRFLAALGVLTIIGLGGAGYYYLTQARQDTAETPAETASGDSATPSIDAAQSAAPSPLSGSDPVAAITSNGTVVLATATETLDGVLDYSVSQMATPVRYVGLTDTIAFIVDNKGTAWRANYRNGEAPVNLVELGTPTSTTTFHFLGLPDGRIYFADSAGSLWTVDNTNQPGSVYKPESPDFAIVDIAANDAELYILTANGDVRIHEHGSADTRVGYGPTNEQPAVVSIAPTEVGALLTASGGTVRVADPTATPTVAVLHKRRPNDKATNALPAGAGGAVLTEKGNVLYSARGDKDIDLYTTAAQSAGIATILRTDTGAVGGVDADGNVWAFDVAGGAPLMIWDSSIQGEARQVEPNQNSFTILDPNGNLWLAPLTPGGQTIQLTDTGDASNISTPAYSPAPA